MKGIYNTHYYINMTYIYASNNILFYYKFIVYFTNNNYKWYWFNDKINLDKSKYN